MPGNRTCSEVASMVLTWWTVAFLRSDSCCFHKWLAITFVYCKNSWKLSYLYAATKYRTPDDITGVFYILIPYGDATGLRSVADLRYFEITQMGECPTWIF